jgi:DNA replication protein DnaC
MFACMAHALSFFGGVPKAIVSDNLKSAVTRSSKYEPEVNRSFKDFARHYGCVINPTRSYSPQDKALVENAVHLTYQRIYYPMREMVFFSLADLNAEIRKWLELYNNQTIEKLKQMRLGAMADLHLHHLKNNQLAGITADEYLALLTDHEWENRQNTKISGLLRTASFKQNASVADISYTAGRNLDKNMFNRIATLDFMPKKENVIITGASGTGKSYLSQALGNQACLMGYRVQYTNTARLFTKLRIAKADGTYIKECKKINKIDLLILDDFGLQSFDNHARESLMDIIDDRYNQSSTIVSSQIPVSAWYDIIGEGTIADAILDRLVNSSHRIDLKGDSMRKGILKNE